MRKILKINRDINAIEEWARNLSEADRECPLVKEYLNKRIKDYEAYDTMHDNDGIVGVSISARRL